MVWTPDKWDELIKQRNPLCYKHECYGAGAEAMLIGVIDFLRTEQNNYDNTFYGACCRKIANKLEGESDEDTKTANMVKLSYKEGLSSEEIAEQIGISEDEAAEIISGIEKED